MGKRWEKYDIDKPLGLVWIFHDTPIFGYFRTIPEDGSTLELFKGSKRIAPDSNAAHHLDHIDWIGKARSNGLKMASIGLTFYVFYALKSSTGSDCCG